MIKFSQPATYREVRHFGDPHKVWMVNFRIRDLEKMVAQLRAAGIEVKIDPQSYSNDRFARLHDPEGNPIEWWQPTDLDPALDAPHQPRSRMRVNRQQLKKALCRR
jgi:hypothetical protein